MPVWDTAQRPAREQFGFWREVICEAFVPLTPSETVKSVGFVGEVETRELGHVNRARIRSSPQLTAHGPLDVSRTDSAHYFVNLQLAGRCLVRQGREESLVEPGRFTVVDTTEPYFLDFEAPWQMLSFRVPHALISSRLPDPRHGTGVGIEGSSGLGGVAAALVRSLWELGDPPDEAATIELEQSLASVVALAMGATATREDPSFRVAMRAAVLRHVTTHLGDPGLSVASVCRRFAISPRLLHTLFEDQERTFSETVRAMRLDRCARLIADPRTTASITEIAAAHGFLDPTSFSRAFRRRFGVAPREMRRSAQERNVADGS
jgi:AraC family transcriptional regulator, positive regulator of tynA and feaB